jgi:hypothetical protein
MKSSASWTPWKTENLTDESPLTGAFGGMKITLYTKRTNLWQPYMNLIRKDLTQFYCSRT